MCVSPLGCLSLYSLVVGSRLTLYVSGVCACFTHTCTHIYVHGMGYMLGVGAFT